ncbi:hypothetical protein D6821_00100 [Candidatus Parcubacteria bacterium]|nr:MAG: hypothetical protein D6821_00100 [Candidatus Parcubacteria bacterium]
MKKFLASSVLVLGIIFSFVLSVQAQSNLVSITPAVIDERAVANEIFNYELTLRNNTDKHLFLYPVIFEVDSQKGRQLVSRIYDFDKTKTLARWIRIKRNTIELPPGAEVKRKLTIDVDLRAVPGRYYAEIVFARGANKLEAELRAQQEAFPTLKLNFEVKEQAVEKMQLLDFTSSKNTYLSWPVNLIIKLKNVGNKELTPQGSIFIYNRRGEEVAKLAVNSQKQAITAEAESEFKTEWRGKKIGKYKARLELEYGSQNPQTLQDTVYFWVFSWGFLLFFGGGIFFLVILLSVVIFQRTFRHSQHLSHRNSPHLLTPHISPAKRAKRTQTASSHILDLKG